MPAARSAVSIGGRTWLCTTRQQDIVARHAEALAELLLGEQRHRGAGALQAIGIDDEVGCARRRCRCWRSTVRRRWACRAAWSRSGRSAGRRRRNCARPRYRDRRAGCRTLRPSRSARAGRGRRHRRASSPASSRRDRAAASARLRKISRSASGMPVGSVSTMRRRRRGVSAWARRPRCCGEFISVSACSRISVSEKVMIEERE